MASKEERWADRYIRKMAGGAVKSGNEPDRVKGVYETPKGFVPGPPDPVVKKNHLDYDGSLRACACRLVAVWWPIGGHPQKVVFSCDKNTRDSFAHGHSSRIFRRLIDASERGLKASLLPSEEQLEPLEILKLMNMTLSPNTYKLYSSFTQRRMAEEEYAAAHYMADKVQEVIRRR